MASTVIGLFENPTQAERARSEVEALRIPNLHVQVYDKAGPQITGGTDTSARGFWDSLSETLGFGPSNQAMYQEGVRRGGTVVKVQADDSRTDEVADILNRCGAVDIDERAAEWGGTSETARAAPPLTQQGAIIPEPEDVGARPIKRGNVCVYRHDGPKQRVA